MDRVHLGKSEKIVFRAIGEYDFDKAKFSNLSKRQIATAAESLKEKGLIDAIINYDDLLSAKETNLGSAYKIENPHLWNPVSETIKWLIPMAITAAIAIFSIIMQYLQQ